MNALSYLLDHRAEFAAYLTYAMLSLVVGSYALLGFARGVRKLALASTWEWDDALSLRLLSAAEWIEARVRVVARWHASIMPTLDPTPSLERAEAEERLARARSQLGARGQ